jgi:hypothetical protein
MIAIVIALTLLLAAMIAFDYTAPVVKEWVHRRQVVRRSAADQEMQAMRAAQQLALMAWQARHQMYDLASEGRASRSEHPARHK